METKSEWEKPRQGVQQRARKHDIEACYIAAMGCLLTGNSNVEMEATVGMAASLISIVLERFVHILDKHLTDEMQLMDSEEKEYCLGAAKSHPGLIYLVDGKDFPMTKSLFSELTKKTSKIGRLKEP